MGTMTLSQFPLPAQRVHWAIFQVQCGDLGAVGSDVADGCDSLGNAAVCGTMAAVERASADNSTLWAATTDRTCVFFISKNRRC